MTATDRRCGACGRVLLAHGPSPDFCDQDCQEDWHQGRRPLQGRRAGRTRIVAGPEFRQRVLTSPVTWEASYPLSTLEMEHLQEFLRDHADVMDACRDAARAMTVFATTMTTKGEERKERDDGGDA